jgi:hypothetical protein
MTPAGEATGVSLGWARCGGILFDQEDELRRTGDRFNDLWKQGRSITNKLLEDLAYRADRGFDPLDGMESVFEYGKQSFPDYKAGRLGRTTGYRTGAVQRTSRKGGRSRSVADDLG